MLTVAAAVADDSILLSSSHRARSRRRPDAAAVLARGTAPRSPRLTPPPRVRRAARALGPMASSVRMATWPGDGAGRRAHAHTPAATACAVPARVQSYTRRRSPHALQHASQYMSVLRRSPVGRANFVGSVVAALLVVLSIIDAGPSHGRLRLLLLLATIPNVVIVVPHVLRVDEQHIVREHTGTRLIGLVNACKFSKVPDRGFMWFHVVSRT